jgi:site-specific recombinase XerD
MIVERKINPRTQMAGEQIFWRGKDTAGQRPRFMPYLRHAMVKRGTNLLVVQEVMGHKDLKTTSLYVGLARSG